MNDELNKKKNTSNNNIEATETDKPNTRKS